MPNPRLAYRYAKSILDLAIERGELETVFADMQWLHQLTTRSPEFTNLLRSPIVKAEKKGKVVESIVKSNVSTLTSSFVHLLIVKARESHLPEIVTAFIEQYKKHKNIYPVKLTTAFELSEDLKNAIIAQIRKTSDMQNIELETVVDKNLIGGFVLESGDKLIDASIAYELRQISRSFENNDFVYKLR